MARTKQTARKSTGGKAPRRAAVAKFAARKQANPNFLINNNISDDEDCDVALPEEETPEVIHFDVSHETSFYAHWFPTGSSSKTFEPKFSLANCLNPLTQEPESYLAVSFNSKFDGDGMRKLGRPSLNLVLALDISGSMSLPFQGENNKSKIQVAKECIAALISQLRPEDRFGLILFNDKPSVFQKLDKWSNINSAQFLTKLNALRAAGGTEISSAVIKAKNEYKDVPEEPNVSNRMFFLTDMEVSPDDGLNFTDLVSSNAKEAKWSTVVGIGLDLTGDVITRVSSTTGCNYSNVRSSAYFKEFVETEFDYSVTAIGYGIEVALESEAVSIQRAYGSYELRSLPQGSKKVFFSTEFPGRKNESGETRGGVLLFKLDGVSSSMNLKISTTWQTQNGIPKSNNQELTVPAPKTFQDLLVRKAVFLHHYASFMRTYVDTRHESTPEGFKRYVELRKQFPVIHRHLLNELPGIQDADFKSEVSMIEQFAKDDDIPLDASAPACPVPSPDCTDSMELETPLLKRKFDDSDGIPDEETLKATPRAVLQALCKAHGIKANSTTQVLVQELTKLSASKMKKTKL